MRSIGPAVTREQSPAFLRNSNDIAYRKGWINEEKMRELAQPMLKNQYGQYLLKVIDEVKRFGSGLE